MKALGRRGFVISTLGTLLFPKLRAFAKPHALAMQNLFERSLPGIPTITTMEYVKAANGKDRASTASLGCGVVMQQNGKDVVVTVAHVVGTSNLNQYRDIYAYFPDSSPCAMEIELADWNLDLAVLSFVDPIPNNLLRFNTAVAQAGDPLTLISRIMNSDRIRKVVNINNHSDKEPDNVLVQRVIDRWFSFKYPYDMIGKSGSPLLNAQGDVVGLMTQATPKALAGIAFTGLALGSKTVQEFLDKPQGPARVKRAQLLNPGPAMPGFQPAAGALPVVQQLAPGSRPKSSLKVTGNGQIVTDRFQWTASHSQMLPRGVEPPVNKRILNIAGHDPRAPNREPSIITDGRDRFLQNHFMGFSALLGSTFTSCDESIDLNNRVYSFVASSDDLAHQVHLDVVPTTTQNPQNELVRVRRSVLRFCILASNEEPAPGEQIVELGPVDRVLATGGQPNWSSFQENGIPWCHFRYRSYMDATGNETVALYVHHLPQRLMFIAWFSRQGGAYLDFQYQPSIDQWAFLLTFAAPK